MTRNHLKARAAPRTWNIERKNQVFTMRPNPGSQRLELTLPLAHVIRALGVANTRKEINHVIRANDVLVNGVRRWDVRFGVGFMDVITIPAAKLAAVLTMDAKGRLAPEPVEQKAAGRKLAQVRGASKVRGGKLQIHTSDGRCVLADKPIRTGSTVALDLPGQHVAAVYAVEPQVPVILTSGKHRGTRGTVKEIDAEHVTITTDGGEISTKASYAFALGGKP